MRARALTRRPAPALGSAARRTRPSALTLGCSGRSEPGQYPRSQGSLSVARRLLTLAQSRRRPGLSLTPLPLAPPPNKQFVADGVFYAELNELLTRELAEQVC